MRFILIGLAIQFILNKSAEYILAAENVCFRATGFVSDNTFNAPSDGEISGIKLVHKTGGVTCSSNAQTNWGCGATAYGVQMIRIDDSLPGFTYYPTDSTQDISSLDDAVCDKCKVGWYYMDTSISPNDDQLILIDSENPYQITTNDQFSLQYWEGCCGSTTHDNSGTACADVYFLYEAQSSRQYVVVTESKIWQNAKTHCADVYGSSLATVITEDDQANLLSAIADAEVTEVWTGLNDIGDREGTFVWDDGTSCINSDRDCINGDDDTPKWWGDDEPNNTGGGEDCGIITASTDSGRTSWWNDGGCSRVSLPFACNLDDPIIEYKVENVDGNILVNTGTHSDSKYDLNLTSAIGDNYASIEPLGEVGCEELCFADIADSSESCIKVPENIDSTAIENLSFELYLKQRTYETHLSWIMSQDDGPFDRSILMQDTRYGTGSKLALGNGGTYTSVQDPLELDEYTHLVAVWEGGQGGTASLYLDGEFIQSVTIERDSVSSFDYFCLNTNPGHDNHGWDGCMNEIRVYDYALPPHQVAVLAERQRSKERYCIHPCDEEDIGSFNWETLVKDGADIPQFDVVEFNVTEDSLTLDIMVELEYLGSVVADNDDEADYGVTYVLDFEDYNAHKNKINEPGSCQNREAADFSDTTLSFEDYWDYSTQPILNGVGTDEYLAYPPPGDDWSVYMKEGDECSTIVYEGHFHWNDLVSCQSYDGSLNYITTEDGEDEITLDGVFYINVVSPFVSNEETSYYRVYQLLSQPFTISISKSVFVMGSTGINILSMSVISVYKEDGANTFRLIVLTESYEYLMLTRDNNNLYIYNPADGGSIKTGDFFTASSEAVSVDEGCLDNKEFVCTQLWEITAENVDCRNGNAVGVDFSGDYTLQFVPECRSVDDIGSDLNTYCAGWLSSHSDIEDGVDLLASLTWKDEVCDPLLFEMQFEASMTFFTDANYENLAADDQLYQAGEDAIYVEIDTSFPSDTYSVFDTELINVWICTFDPLEGPQEPIDPNTASGGCFSANRDGGNATADNPYFYHVYSVDGPIEEEGFNLIGHPDDSESNKNKLQFSFIVPSKIRRDTLYIHSQIEVSLTDEPEEQFRRRLLRRTRGTPRASANQMDHFLGNIGINRNHKPNHDENYNYNPNPNQYQPPPQQIPFQSPAATTTTTWSFYISSSWIIGIGSILGLILFGNILYLFYMNCLDKPQRARVSFNHRRRSGYDSVKNVDSEDFDNSEAHLIVDQQEQHREESE